MDGTCHIIDWILEHYANINNIIKFPFATDESRVALLGNSHYTIGKIMC